MFVGMLLVGLSARERRRQAGRNTQAKERIFRVSPPADPPLSFCLDPLPPLWNQCGDSVQLPDSNWLGLGVFGRCSPLVSVRGTRFLIKNSEAPSIVG